MFGCQHGSLQMFQINPLPSAAFAHLSGLSEDELDSRGVVVRHAGEFRLGWLGGAEVGPAIKQQRVAGHDLGAAVPRHRRV